MLFNCRGVVGNEAVDLDPTRFYQLTTYDYADFFTKTIV